MLSTLLYVGERTTTIDRPSTAEGLGSILSIVFVLAIIVYLAFRATKTIAARYGGGAGVSGRDITVLERVAVDKDNSLVIARVGDRVWLLGAGAGGIRKIEELDASRFGNTPADMPGRLEFSALLSDFIKKPKKADAGPENNSQQSGGEKDE